MSANLSLDEKLDAVMKSNHMIIVPNQEVKSSS